jgi:hypothetical protein
MGLCMTKQHGKQTEQALENLSRINRETVAGIVALKIRRSDAIKQTREYAGLDAIAESLDLNTDTTVYSRLLPEDVRLVEPGEPHFFSLSEAARRMNISVKNLEAQCLKGQLEMGFVATTAKLVVKVPQ